MKRMPSKPLFGMPVAVGTSLAVMAMRRVPWPNADESAASNAAAASARRECLIGASSARRIAAWEPNAGQQQEAALSVFLDWGIGVLPETPAAGRVSGSGLLPKMPAL